MPNRPSSDWTFKRKALAQVHLAGDGLELGRGRDRFMADAEDAHPGAQAGPEGGAPGDDVVDLHRRRRPKARPGRGRTRKP